MKCSTLIYINPDDPRIFVYKHNRCKWVGVTLNFAHGKSFPVLAALLLPLIVLPLLLCWPQSETGRGVLIGLYLTIDVTATCIICFRGAARDLRRYPGKPAARG